MLISKYKIQIRKQEMLCLPQEHHNSLEEQAKALKPADISQTGENEAVQVMQLALHPDAVKRTSAARLLQHARFRE